MLQKPENQQPHLISTNSRKHLNATGGEDFEGRDSPEVPPVIAIVGPDEAGVVVAYVFPGDKLRAVGKNDIVFGQTFLSNRR